LGLFSSHSNDTRPQDLSRLDEQILAVRPTLNAP
jgi:hypothetical protein